MKPGSALQRALLGVPRVLAVCTLSMFGRRQTPRAPQRSMRLEPTAGIFLVGIVHCASALLPRDTLAMAHPRGSRVDCRQTLATLLHLTLLVSVTGRDCERTQYVFDE